MKFNPHVIDALSPADFDSFLRQQGFVGLHQRDLRFGKSPRLAVRTDAVLKLLSATQSQLVHLMRTGKLSRPFRETFSGNLVWLQKDIEPLMRPVPEPQRRVGFLG